MTKMTRLSISGSLVFAVTALFLLPCHDAAAQARTPTEASPEYRLGAGDAVRITVFQNPDLTLETRISESGIVSFPLLGTIRIGGLTISQAEKVIADGLREGNFVKQPQVSMLVLQIRANQVSVLGQVNRAGRFPIDVADLRLADVLAIAGGIASSGADMVVVAGTRGGKPFRAEIDLPNLFSPEGSPDISIQNGDVVWVDRAPVVYIYGEVQRPGTLRLERNMTVLQVLASGGGLTLRGTVKGLRLHRKGLDGKTVIVQPEMDDVVRKGDVVYVRESLF